MSKARMSVQKVIFEGKRIADFPQFLVCTQGLTICILVTNHREREEEMVQILVLFLRTHVHIS